VNTVWPEYSKILEGYCRWFGCYDACTGNVSTQLLFSQDCCFQWHQTHLSCIWVNTNVECILWWLCLFVQFYNLHLLQDSYGLMGVEMVTSDGPGRKRLKVTLNSGKFVWLSENALRWQQHILQAWFSVDWEVCLVGDWSGWVTMRTLKLTNMI
jgi:hypothetical protein